MGLFDQGRALLDATGYDERLDYLRDGLLVVAAVPAKSGQTAFLLEDSGPAAARLFRQDFIVRAADLPGIVPEPGDEIDWRGRRFLVGAPASEPCWRWHDRQCLSYRIHAEEVRDGAAL